MVGNKLQFFKEPEENTFTYSHTELFFCWQTVQAQPVHLLVMIIQKTLLKTLESLYQPEQTVLNLIDQ